MIQRLLLVLAFLLLSTPGFAKGGVVSAPDPRAAEAGREILRAGGSAADAAMAMMLALTVVEPHASGIGGGGFLVHHDAGTGAIATVDGRETAPASATPDRFLGPDGKPLPFAEAFPGGKSVGVPGNIRLMARVHQRWGKLPWARLFDPAIRMADEGYSVSPIMAGRLSALAKVDAAFPAFQALFWEGGKPKPAGATVRNPAFAALLRRMAAEGPDAFYRGATAVAISRAVASSPRAPAEITLADLAAYQAKDRPAVCGRYRGYRICGMGPPSSGATTVLQILGMLERFPMATLGKEDPRAWHLIGEAMLLAYADRDKYLGDPDFVAVPVAGLIDPAYLKGRSRLISEKKSLGVYEAGTPPGAPARTPATPGEVGGTSHFVAVDGDGDIASMTSTVEGSFGSQLVAEGMILNNELTDFSFAPEKDGAPVANRVEPGKRPLSSMSPTIVYDMRGNPILAIGSAGGKRIIMHVAKALIGVLDWGLPAAEAIALPNIFFAKNALLVEQGTALAAMRPALEKLGHIVTPADLGSKLNAAERTPQGWRGAADPRSEGIALVE